MTCKRFIRLLAPAWLLGLSLAAAAEPLLEYRNIRLGDSLPQVLEAAARAFPVVRPVPERKSYDALRVTAGDSQGLKNNECNYFATANLQKRCLSAYLVFSSEQQGTVLNNIFVQQAFVPAIDRKALLASLVRLYGMPRFRSDDTVPATTISPASKATALLWGGAHAPRRNYWPSTFPAEDRDIVGGRYVSIVIHHQGGRANGYSLRIVDTGSTELSAADMRAERDRLDALHDSGAGAR